VGPRVGMYGMEKRKLLTLAGLASIKQKVFIKVRVELLPVIQPVASRDTDCTTAAPNLIR
jgi:hypothetical protein